MEILQIIITIILVGVTIYYANQTRLTVIEMKKARQFEFFPALSIKLSQINKTVLPVRLFVQVMVWNVGKGLAKNPEILFPSSKWQKVKTLAPGETDDASILISSYDIIANLPESERYIKIKYHDIFDREFISKALIIEKKSANGDILVADNWEIVLPKN